MSGRRVYRDRQTFITAHGDGPWLCGVCDQLIYKFGRGVGLGNVHHVDDDYTNGSLENLVAIHHECHAAEHPITDEMKQQISRKLKGRPSPTKGRPWTPERRERQVAGMSGVNNPFHGRTHSDETRARMRATWAARRGRPTARRGRPLPEETKAKMRGPRSRKTCVDCKKDWGGSWFTRHKLEGHCVV